MMYRSLGLIAAAILVFQASVCLGQEYASQLKKCKQLYLNGKHHFPEQMSNFCSCMEGANLPGFDLTSANHTRIQKSDLLGKVTLINFWFIQCPPCIFEIPELNKMPERINDQNFRLVSLTPDSQSEIDDFM